MAFKNKKTYKFPFLPFLLTLIGTAFCMWNVLAKDTVFCLTTSCNVFNDFTILGISLWVYGLIVFSLATFSMIFRFRSLTYFILTCCVLGDIGLLILMFFTAPCFNCLIVAALMGFSFLFLLFHGHSKKLALFIFSIWFCLFALNVAQIVKLLVSPFPSYTATLIKDAPENASMRIYFSPSCSACQETVALLGSRKTTDEGNIAWYPVSENLDDIQYVAAMNGFLEKGDQLSLALEKALASPLVSQNLNLQSLLLLPTQIKLLVNQAHLNAAGTTSIPFIEIIGLPEFLKNTSVQNPQNPLEILQGIQTNQTNNPFASAFCDNSSSEPCVE